MFLSIKMLSIYAQILSDVWPILVRIAVYMFLSENSIYCQNIVHSTSRTERAGDGEASRGSRASLVALCVRV